MARSILDIVIKLSKQGTGDREATKTLVQVKSGLANIAAVAGIVTGALYTAKKAFDFAKEGAQLQFVEQRFNRLSDSIGATSGLMNDLRETTRGLYSDTELMASANDLMSLGLAQNSEELLRLARVSAGLNMNMNQLVLTLTNMTTMRFDALGVSVTGFKEKVADLEKAGLSANDAFKEAFLQQAEAQLDRVGEAADSNAGAFMRLEAALKNMGDAAKKAFSEAVTPVVSGLADMAEGEIRSTQAAAEHAKYINIAKGAIRDLTGQVNISTGQASAFAHQLELATEYDRRWVAMLQQTSTTLADATAAGDAWSMSLDTVQAIISGPIIKAQEDYHKTLADLQTELVDLQAQESKWGSPPVGSQKYDELQGKIADVKTKIDETTAAYQEQARQIEFNLAQQQILASSLSEDQQSQAIAILGQSMGMWDEQTANAIQRTSEWVSMLEQGSITADQFAVRLNQMGEATFGVSTRAEGAIDPLVKLTGGAETLSTEGFTNLIAISPHTQAAIDGVAASFGETSQQAFAAADKASDVEDQLTKMDGLTATVTVNIIVNGELPNVRGITGNYNAARNTGGFLAEGGMLRGGLNVVGEKGWEAIVQDRSGNYQVIPHDVSKKLAGLGLLDTANFMAEGGTLGGGRGAFGERVTVREVVNNAAGQGGLPQERFFRELDDRLRRQETTLVNAFMAAMIRLNP